MAHVLQGVYAPLPQSLSDSDSDKEINMEPVCGNNYNGKPSDSRKINSFSYLQNGHQMVFNEIVEDMHQAKLLEDIEFQGKCNLVKGPYKGSILNIALMYKGSFNNHMDQKNGIALLKDNNGLKAVESLTGETLWYAHSAQGKSIPELDMPIKLKDMNNDDVEEMLSVYEKHSLLLISGKDGKALQNIKLSTPCVWLEKLERVEDFIRYLCSADKLVYKISLDNLEAVYRSDQEIIAKPFPLKDEFGIFEAGADAEDSFCACGCSGLLADELEYSAFGGTYTFLFCLMPLFASSSSLNNFS
nr:unnamed protein product [Callosobruchus analis]